MAEVDKHKPGAVCWIELSSTDQNAAKGFYTSLFGWEFQDVPIGADEVYTLFALKGRVSAAAFSQQADENAMGIPSHWKLYIGVENADDAAKRAGELGAKVLAPPFDVNVKGRMAVLQDPTGAVFSVWQPKQRMGIGIHNEPGSLCWADLNSPDPQAAGAFYSKLFGWELEPGQGDSGYLHIKNGGDYIGGIPPVSMQNPGAPPHWMIYLQVSDCDASTAKAKALGGRVYMEPMTLEKTGRFSIIADPTGAVSSLFEQHRA